MKKWLAVILGMVMLVSCTASLAQEAVVEAAYDEIAAGVYQIENSGYLIVGTDKAALFNGNMRDQGAQATVAMLAGDKEVLPVSTASGEGQDIDLGGFTLQAVPFSGAMSGTVYLDKTNKLLVSGRVLGNGTADLSKQYPDADAPAYINGYRAYLSSLNGLSAQTAELDSVTVLAADGVMDQQYLKDLNTVVQMFVDVDTQLTLISSDAPGNVGDFSCTYGTASVLVHMPFGGLYGYELGGSTMCTSDDQYKFYITDYGKFQTIRDTDIQSCYVLMNDTDALLIDCDMYNGKLFWETVDKLIGDRTLSVYITHNHGDHVGNLEDLDVERLTKLYWPKDEEAPSWGYNPLADERFADKIEYLEYDKEYTIAGHDLVLCKMTAHTSGGSAVVDKTDRVLFSGDSLGTQTYKGGTSTGRLTAEEYLSELVYLSDTYGAMFDDVYQAHNLYTTPKVIDYLKTACQAFIDSGTDVMINGTVFAFDGTVLTPDKYTSLFGNSLFDDQMPFAVGLGIGAAAMDAQAAK